MNQLGNIVYKNENDVLNNYYQVDGNTRHASSCFIFSTVPNLIVC